MAAEEEENRLPSSPLQQTERELAQLRASLEATTDGIVVTDANRQVIGFNHRYAEMWGLPPRLLETRDHKRLVEACSGQVPDRATFVATVDSIYRDAPAETFDVLELADGRVFERLSRLQLVEGRNAGRVWSFRDVTERRRLAEGRFRLAAIVESSDDAIVGKTLAGIITNWNRSAERMFGYKADEIIGRPVTTLIPAERIAEEAAIIERLRKGERIEQFETVRLRKDGSEIDVSLTVSPIKDDHGKIIGAAKIARDITDRVRAARALDDETRVLEVLNKSGQAIASQLDLQSLIQSVTDSATELSGADFGAFFYNHTDEKGESYQLYTLSGASPEAFEDFGQPRATPLFGPTFHGAPAVRIADVLQDPRFGQMAPYYGMPPGHLSVRSYLAVSVVSRTGEVIGGLFFGHPEPGVFSERTERVIVGLASQAAIAIDNARLYGDVKRLADERTHLLDAERAARAEAERVNLMKDEFLATLSHELRTPLNAILGWSQLLAMGHMGPEEMKQGLETIERNAKAQTQLIEDLLDMNRIISGNVRLDVQSVNLAKVVDTAIESVGPSAEAKQIRVRKIIDPLAGPVSGDPNRLQQVVWNLLTNAVKFTPRGGRIEAIVARVNSHLEITISDSGQGISAEFLPFVFERFRQADSSTTRRYGGLGLGLSIVKQLVELHGGSVRVESPGEGQGATFIVSLPLAPVRRSGDREHPATSNDSTHDWDAIQLGGVKVLVVDDETDARTLVKRVLAGRGAEVFIAASASEGLQLLKAHQPHVLVSDIGMPEVDGYAFARMVRALPAAEGGRTPAIALTAFARSEDRTRALIAGYQVHISKPIEAHELLVTVASLAGRMQSGGA